MSSARIVFTASEMYPFSKSGGLADVMGALPLALHKMGIPTAVISPLYGSIDIAEYDVRLIMADCPVGYPWPSVTCEVYEALYHGMPVYFINRAEYFDRRHYYNSYSGDYFDNGERFIFFSRAVVALMRCLGHAPQIIHANDWQTALVPAYVHFLRQYEDFWQDTRTVLSIHNLAFQGRFSSRLFEHCGLPHEAWHMDAMEYWGDCNFLKAGIAYADEVLTVSPSYAKEIMSPHMGCGLDGILRRREGVQGILNGVDYSIWNPETDTLIAAQYSATNLGNKAVCKRALMQECGLDASLAHRPILGFIGRFRGQKGIDILLESIPSLMKAHVGMVILGEGDSRYEARARDFMQEYKGRLCTVLSYTEDLAHHIQAGSDIFLMPSRYEPCGLTQMYALRYGTLPVATAVGGLCDSICAYPEAECTGFTFAQSQAEIQSQAATQIQTELFLKATKQAIDLWTTDKAAWHAMQVRAMQKHFTWERAAQAYVQVYEELLAPASL